MDYCSAADFAEKLKSMQLSSKVFSPVEENLIDMDHKEYRYWYQLVSKFMPHIMDSRFSRNNINAKASSSYHITI